MRGEGTAEAALESLRLVWPAYFASPQRVMPFPPGLRLSVEAYASLLAAAIAALPALERSLPAIHAPFGVVSGAPSPMPAPHETVAAISGAWLEVVTGAGRFVWFERPGSVRAGLPRLTGAAIPTRWQAASIRMCPGREAWHDGRARAAVALGPKDQSRPSGIVLVIDELETWSEPLRPLAAASRGDRRVPARLGEHGPLLRWVTLSALPTVRGPQEPELLLPGGEVGTDAFGLRLRRRLRRVVATFALAHMSCAGAWAWGTVPDRLRAAQHDVVAPDLTLVAGATPESHAGELTAAVGKDRPARSVVLAGHSYGGLVVPRAAELLGDAAAALVVVEGLMPEAGESGFDLRSARAEARRAEGRERGDGMWTAGTESPEPVWWSRLLPMPVSAFDAGVELTGTAAQLPGWFVHCLKSDFADQAARARARGWTVVEVDGVHALPLADPATCVQILLRVAGFIATAQSRSTGSPPVGRSG